MKQRDILALMDGIAPGIAASFAKAIAPMLARLEAAEKRVAELEAAPADIDLDALIAAGVEKALAGNAATVAKLATDLDEVRILVTGLPGPDGLAALVDKAVDTKVAALPPVPTAAEVAALVPPPPTAEAVAALVPAGRDADPEAIRSAVATAVGALVMPTAAEIAALVPPPPTVEAIAALVPPGKDADLEAVHAMVAAEVAKTTPTAEAIAALVPAPPTAEAVAALVPAGKDADPETIKTMVAEAAAALVAPIQAGIEETLTEVKAAVPTAADVAALVPAPAPGKDADPEAVKALVAAAVADLPPAKDGQDATPEQITAAVEKVLATWERPKDGASVTIEQLRPLVDETVAKRIAEIPAPKDGVGMAGAVIDREGELALTMTDGTVVKLGQVIGKDGDPGLGFDDLEVTHDGERRFTFRLMQGDRVKEFPFSLPVVLDRGVFKDGTEYVAGDGATWGGSFWIARTTTKDKPGTSDAWRLSVKKGRDGQDLRSSEPKPPAKVKL